MTAKLLGIAAVLLAVCVYTAVSNDSFLKVVNLQNVVHRTALYGILSIGAAFVIITGGIDLSIGSVVCLAGVSLPFLLTELNWSPWVAVPTVIVISAAIGISHGLLITKVRLQPFVVTLCGFLLYRGIARGITGDQAQGFGGGYETLRLLATKRIPIFGSSPDLFHLPATMVVLIVVALSAAVFLNLTVFGRYLLALGSNSEAARYSGIRVDRMVILAYILCSVLAGLGGMLLVMDVSSAQPSDFGMSYELYAIAAAVLGGCSLRGGEGSILGVIIGAALIVMLSNMIILVHPNYQNIEFAIIGGVILAGVILDETVRRIVAARRLAARQRLA